MDDEFDGLVAEAEKRGILDDETKGLIAEYRTRQSGVRGRAVLASQRQRFKTPAEQEAEQSSIVGPAAVVGSATKRAFATDPALSTASMLVGGTAEALGGEALVPNLVSPSAQAEYLAKQAPSDPGAAYELAQRATMAKGGVPGALTAGARGLAGGAEGAFMFAPAAGGAKALGAIHKLRAAGTLTPEAFQAAVAGARMLGPGAAGAIAPSVPGVDAIAELPAMGGRALARGLGAPEGSASEAVGGTLGAVAPAFLPLAFAKGAGRAAGAGTVEPAFRVGQTPLGRLGGAVAREGGLASILKKSPTVGYEAANIGAMLPQSHIAPEASRAAQGLGASPEGAELIGQMTGLAGTLPVAAMEGRIAGIGAKQGMAERATADAQRAKAAEATQAKAAADAQIAALKSHEAPQTPTPDQAETAYLQEMMAKDAERKRALAGVAGAVEGARGVESTRSADEAAAADLGATVKPPRPVAPDPLAEGIEGPPPPPDPLAEAAAEAKVDAAKAAEYRKELDPFKAKVAAEQEAAMRERDRAASEEWQASAAHDEAAAAWDAMDPAQRKAVVDRMPPGILRTGEMGRSFDKFDIAKKEHIAEAIKNPEAFAEVLPEPEAPAAPPKGVVPTVPAAGEAPVAPTPSQPPAPAPAESGVIPAPGAAARIPDEVIPPGPQPLPGAKPTTQPPADLTGLSNKEVARAMTEWGDYFHETFDEAAGRNFNRLADELNKRMKGPFGPPREKGGAIGETATAGVAEGRGVTPTPDLPPAGKSTESGKSPAEERFAAREKERIGKKSSNPVIEEGRAAALVHGDRSKNPYKSGVDDPSGRGRELSNDWESGFNEVPESLLGRDRGGNPPSEAPPESPRAAKVRKLFETRLRSQGEVSVKGTDIRLDTTSQPYRVIVNQKEVFSGSPEEAFARADQEIAKASRGTTLGSGLGALDLSDPVTRKVIRGTLGGATGYIVGIANDEPDDTPEGRAARRALWTAAGIGAATGLPGFAKRGIRSGQRLVKKAQPDWFREYFGNPNERISETHASIVRGRMDKEELGKTQAHIEAIRTPGGLKGSQARIYQDALRGDPKAKEVLPKLIDHIRQTNPDLADAMEAGPDYYKPQSLARTQKEVDLGIRTTEAQEEYPEGHVQRVYQTEKERPARATTGGKPNNPKIRMGEKAADAPYWKGSLDPVTVELIMDEYGMPKPAGEHTYFRGTDEGGTLVKWFPDKEGEEQRQMFLLALSEYAKQSAVKPISAGKIVGGGDDRMVVQVGKGSRADIGHLVSKVSDAPNELLVRAPRSIANEIVKTLGLEAPKVTPSGSRLRYEFKNPGDVAQFENAVRELAVEGSTFNVTPAAKAYFRNRLKGAKVKIGPGQSGGIGHLTEETGPAMNYRERRVAGEVYNPQAVVYKSSYEQSKRIAAAEMYRELATKSDEHGPFAAERPVSEEGVPEALDKDGYFTANGVEYKFIPKDKTGRENFGELAGKGLRRDAYEFHTEQKEIEGATRGFVHGMLQKWKSLKTGTPVWAALNVPSDMAFAYAADTSPVGGPSNWKSYYSVGKDFLNYLRTGDPIHVKRHVEGPGIRFHEKMTTGNADADAALESLMFGAKESAAKRWEKRGETAMDIASLGTLAGRTAKVGAGLGALGGAAAGTAMGVAEGDDWDEILKRAGKGALIGAGANLTARSIRKTGPLIDAYFKAVAYDIMTKRQGYSHAEAKARVRKFFQNYEEPSKALRIATGKTGNPLAAAIANPFMSFYSELLRIGGNAVAENPLRAAAIFGAIPIAASVYNHYAGTFPDAEEGRAAKEIAPTGIVGRDDEGKLSSAELGRINPGADLMADILAVTKSPNKDTFRRIMTSFGGSTPILNMVDAGKTFFVPDNKDLRTGMEIRRPGESPLRAATRHAMSTATSPLAPEFGTTEQFVEKSLTEPYQMGRRPSESRPDRAVLQSLTGVRIKDIDFGKERRSLVGKRGAALRDLDEWFAKARRERNNRADPEKMAAIKAQYREDRKAIIERYREDRRKKTPQPVGEGR